MAHAHFFSRKRVALALVPGEGKGEEGGECGGVVRRVCSCAFDVFAFGLLRPEETHTRRAAQRGGGGESARVK